MQTYNIESVSMDENPKYDQEGNIYWGVSQFKTNRQQGPCFISTDGIVFFRNNTDDNKITDIEPHGLIRYRNKDHHLHRTNGPAIISSTRRRHWVNGEFVEPIEFFLKFGVI